MALTGTAGHLGRRLVLPALAFAAICAAGPCGVANAAPVFDVDGYSNCTATTVPAPDQDFDGVVTTCCVQHAGIPAPTRFGLGCVAPMDGAADDERPVIVMPMRAAPPEQSQDALDALQDLGDLPQPDSAP